jgi:hypothetical protein
VISETPEGADMSNPRTSKANELKTLRQFWRKLGWPNLHRGQHRLTAVPGGRESDELITWYESGALDDVYLIINRSPQWCAAVYAIRFRIFSRWHGFKLSADPVIQAVEAKRLSPWLERRWFIERGSRREYRRAHSENDKWSWQRIRDSGMHAGLGQ